MGSVSHRTDSLCKAGAAMKPAPAIVGVDTGGTFTDLIAVVGGTLRVHKVLSTPDDPAAAVLRGLHELLATEPAGVVTYGSTVATNALLERRGARVLLVTTAGFEDVIELGRQNRPALYDLEPQPPQPLVSRALRIGVAERTLYDGSILVPLTARAVRAALRAVQQHRADAVAVCLLHAYANPRHERMLGAALRGQRDLFCSLSHQLVAEYREYERLSTTVINAYVGPVMRRHLRTLAGGLGTAARLRVMQSNGGAISAQVASREAVRTVLSGPAAGVGGAWAVARSLGLQRVISFDMGGTSTDVSLIDGMPRSRTEWTIGGLPIKVPAIDIHTVGAGGGSIARVDAGGVLKVGPESAGAVPGPACYGSGRVPTVTDANLLLGRVVAGAFLGGAMRLDVARARTAVSPLATRLRLACEAAAEGIVRVVNAGMERAIRSISVERGHDPRAYTLIAFGGAGGQHAAELSAALGIRRIIVPLHPGLLSAQGAAAADVQRDYVRTVRLLDPSVRQLRALFAPLEHRARSALRGEGFRRCDVIKTVDVRYRGQSYEINLPFTAQLAAAFHAAHRRLYGYVDHARPIEVINVRLLASGRGARPRAVPFRPGRSSRAETQRVRWAGRWLTTPALQRSQLASGTSRRGPALIVELSATTFVPPGWRATVHRTGHLVLTHAR
jgi:N-methylhydantoinase A